MAVTVTSTVIPPSVSGCGAGLRFTQSLFLSDYKVNFTDNGEVYITGNYVLKPEIGIIGQILADMPAGKLKDSIQGSEYLSHWTDYAAISAIAKTKKTVDPIQPPRYYAGKREFDELEVVMVMKEIHDSGNRKDWNTIIRAKLPLPADDTIQSDSPFNPASANYNPAKPVFAYDPDNGYILYSGGEIKWLKTGGFYNGTVNGPVSNYDKLNGLVTFKNGAVLNLKTLELTTLEDGKTVVKNIDPWFVILGKRILGDRKTLLIILGIMVFLLYRKIKSQ